MRRCPTRTRAAARCPVPTVPAAGSGDPLRPAPVRVGPGDVAAHACRHLAYLRHTDPVVGSCAVTVPGLWDLVDMFTPAVAGLIIQPGRAAGQPV
jgi:hypothetical protein